MFKAIKIEIVVIGYVIKAVIITKMNFLKYFNG
jgi:hypothetical protein